MPAARRCVTTRGGGVDACGFLGRLPNVAVRSCAVARGGGRCWEEQLAVWAVEVTGPRSNGLGENSYQFQPSSPDALRNGGGIGKVC
jgi:hypothetical protein